MERVSRVFLCHNSKDKELVASIALALLQKSAVRSWLDRWEISGGTAWEEHLKREFATSWACIIFLGSNGLGPYQVQEIEWAKARSLADPDYVLIPVLLPDADPESVAKIESLVPSLQRLVFSDDWRTDDSLERVSSALRRDRPGPPAFAVSVAVSAESWDTSRRSDQSLLLRGASLRKAMQLLSVPANFDQLSTAFIAASAAARQRRTHIQLSLLATLVVFLIGTSLLFYRLRIKAEDATNKAKSAETAEREARQAETKQKGIAQEALASAVASERIARDEARRNELGQLTVLRDRGAGNLHQEKYHDAIVDLRAVTLRTKQASYTAEFPHVLAQERYAADALAGSSLNVTLGRSPVSKLALLPNKTVFARTLAGSVYVIDLKDGRILRRMQSWNGIASPISDDHALVYEMLGQSQSLTLIAPKAERLTRPINFEIDLSKGQFGQLRKGSLFWFIGQDAEKRTICTTIDSHGANRRTVVLYEKPATLSSISSADRPGLLAFGATVFDKGQPWPLTGGRKSFPETHTEFVTVTMDPNTGCVPTRLEIEEAGKPDRDALRSVHPMGTHVVVENTTQCTSDAAFAAAKECHLSIYDVALTAKADAGAVRRILLPSYASGAQFSADGRYLMVETGSRSYKRQLAVYSFDSNVIAGPAVRVFSDVDDYRLHPSAPMLYVLEHGKERVTLMNLQSEQTKSVSVEFGKVSAFAWGAKPQELLVGTEKGSVLVLDMDRLQTRRKLKTSMASISALATDGQLIIAGRSDGSVSTWNLERTRGLKFLEQGVDDRGGFWGILQYVDSPNSKDFFFINDRGGIWKFDSHRSDFDDAYGRGIPAFREVPTSISIDPSGTYIGVGTNQGFAWIVPTETSNPATFRIGHAKQALSTMTSDFHVHVVFARGGRRAMTLGPDQVARVWDLRVAGAASAEQANTPSISAEPRGFLAEVGTVGRFREVFTGLSDIPHVRGDVVAAAFGDDESELVTAHMEGTLKFWRVGASGVAEVRTVVLNPGSTVSTIQKSGDKLLVGLNDGSAELHSSRAATNMGVPGKRSFAHVPASDGKTQVSAHLSKDNRFVLTTVQQGYPKLWDAETGELVMHFTHLESLALEAHFSPDGTAVVVLCADRRVRFVLLDDQLASKGSRPN